MEDYVGDRDRNSLPQRRLNLIDGSISNYCSILNSPEWLDLIKQLDKLEYVIGDIDTDILG